MKIFFVVFSIFFLQVAAHAQTLIDTAYLSNMTQYDISLRANCDYDVPVLFKKKEKIKKRTDSLFLNTNFEIAGTATVSKVFDKQKLLLLRFQFTPNNVVISNNGYKDSNSKISIAYLSAPVFIKPGTAVKGSNLYYPQEIPSGYKQLINQLISYAHIIDSFPIDCPQTGCFVHEEDRIGVLNSKYQIVAEGLENGFKKYKKSSLNYVSFSNNNIADYKQNLHALITTYNKTSFNIELHEVLTLLVQDKTTSITKSDFLLKQINRIPMLLSDKEVLIKTYSEKFPDLVEVTLSDYINKDEITSSVYKKILGDENYNTVNSKIDSFHKAGLKTDSARYYKTVAAIIYLNSATAKDFARQTTGKNATDIRFKIIIKGLADAGTVAAQKELASVFHSRSNDAKAIDFLISSLIFLNNPTIEIIDSIKAIALDPVKFDTDIAFALRYLLGSLCYRFKTDNSSMALAIMNDILNAINKYSNVASKEKSMQTLGILGNAGLDSTFTIIQPYLNDVDLDIKSKALLALRFVNHSSIEYLLLNVMDTATDNDLKNTVLSVLKYKPFTSNVSFYLSKELKKNTDDVLGINLIRFLKSNEAECLDCEKIFKEVAAQHSSKKVREEAAGFLKVNEEETKIF